MESVSTRSSTSLPAPFAAVSSFTQVYKVALLNIFMRFPVRGEEPQRALPKGSNNPRCGVSGVALNAPKADADPRSDAGE